MTEVMNGNMPIEQLLNILGITMDELVENVDVIKGTRVIIQPTFLGDSLTLKDAIEKYLGELKDKNSRMAKLSIKTYEGVLNQFQVSVNSNPFVSRVTCPDIEIFLKSGKPKSKNNLVPNKDGIVKISPNCYNKRLSILSAFFRRYLTQQGFIKESPTLNIKRMSNGKPTVRFLTPDVQQKVFTAALENKEFGARDYIILFLALNTGLRLDELAQLNIEDLHFDENHLVVRHGKGEKERNVYYNDDFQKTMQYYLKHTRKGVYRDAIIKENALFLSLKGPTVLQRLSYEAMEKVVTRVFRRVGIIEGAAHRLRHTYAINALSSGMSIVDIMYQLGHNNIATTVIYLRLSNDQILNKIKENFPLAMLNIKNIDLLIDGPEKENLLNCLERIGIYES